MKKILQSVTERSRHGSTGRNHDLVMPFLRPALSRFGILVLLYLIQLFSSPEVYAVTPTISNVSGSLQTGQILTITGSNMINEDMTNWDPYFTAHPTAYGFEGASPSADSYCAVGPCGGVYDTTVKLMGNQSIKFNTHGASGANPPADNLTSYNAMSVSAGNNKWYRFYARWNLVSGSWPTNYIKMLYNLLNFYFEPAPSSTGM